MRNLNCAVLIKSHGFLDCITFTVTLQCILVSQGYVSYLFSTEAFHIETDCVIALLSHTHKKNKEDMRISVICHFQNCLGALPRFPLNQPLRK